MLTKLKYISDILNELTYFFYFRRQIKRETKNRQDGTKDPCLQVILNFSVFGDFRLTYQISLRRR